MNELIRDAMTPYFEKIIRKIDILDDRISNIEKNIEKKIEKNEFINTNTNNIKLQKLNIPMSKKVYLDNSTGIEVCEKPIYTIENGEKCFIIGSDKVKVNFNPDNFKLYIEKSNEHEFIPVIFLNRTLDKLDEDGRGGTEFFTVQRLDENNEHNEPMTFNQYKYYFKI